MNFTSSTEYSYLKRNSFMDLSAFINARITHKRIKCTYHSTDKIVCPANSPKFILVQILYGIVNIKKYVVINFGDVMKSLATRRR